MPATPIADLRVSITSTTTTWRVGSTGTVRIRVVNSGLSTVSGAGSVISLAVPTGFVPTGWVTAGQSAGAALVNPTGGGSAFNQVVSTLPVGGYIDVDISGNITAATPPGNATFSAQALLPPLATGASGTVLSATMIVQLLRKQAAVTVVNTVPSLQQNSNVNITTVVNNAGPSDANGSKLTIIWPAGIEVKSYTVTYSGGAAGAATFTEFPFTLPALPNGGTVTVTTAVRVSSCTPCGNYNFVSKVDMGPTSELMTGSLCTDHSVTSAITLNTPAPAVKLTACNQVLCADSTAPVYGYAKISLQATGSNAVIHKQTGKTLLCGEVTTAQIAGTTGCWTSCDLPQNVDLYSGGKCSKSGFDTWYTVQEYVTSTPPDPVTGQLVGVVPCARYEVVLDGSRTGTVQVRQVDTLNTRIC